MSITSEQARRWTRNLLLAFVLVSIGFALGKESARRAQPQAGDPAAWGEAADRLIVYYAHATVRCATCNTIEFLTEDVILDQFGEALDAGTLKWASVDFQKNGDFAERYGVAASGVLLVVIRNGRETERVNLEEVWTKVKDPPAFKTYVADAIRKHLPKTEGGA